MPIFYLLAAVAAVVGLSFFFAWRKRRATSALVASILWLAYAAWEASVQLLTPEADIRVDLLLAYPVLLVAAAWAIVRLARRTA